MNVTSNNLPALIKAVFQNADLGKEDINRMVDAAASETHYPTDAVKKDDPITLIIVKALEERTYPNAEESLEEAEQQISYAIKQLQKAKENINRILNIKSFVEERTKTIGLDAAKSIAYDMFGEEYTNYVYPALGWETLKRG